MTTQRRIKMQDEVGSVTETIVTERGWPGHFICASRCNFRRNTLVSKGDRHIVVSSVGAFFPGAGKPIQEIGCDRFYECMLFVGERDKDGYIDANVSWQLHLPDGVDWSVRTADIDSDRIANENHDRMVYAVVEQFEKLFSEVER